MPDFNPREIKSTFLTPERLSGESAWVGHIPFAFAIIELLKPATFVELGSHHGDSYCAFCQSVVFNKLPTKCTAVDTWRGDEQTGFYKDKILKNLTKHHDPRYKSFSRLYRAMFDDAVKTFADGSIDLLHHDGLHTYEALVHDMKLWLPKMSSRGVVLFHDTVERERDFGVYKYFGEVATKYPAFEFHHSHGLGIIAVGKEMPPAFQAFLSAAVANPDAMRAFFAAEGERIAAMARQAKR
jgi:hypothetical protein